MKNKKIKDFLKKSSAQQSRQGGPKLFL